MIAQDTQCYPLDCVRGPTQPNAHICTHLYLCTTCLSGTHKGQNRIHDPLVLGFLMFVNHYVGAENQI